MRIKILSVQEIGNQLRIKVDSEYGVDDLGLSLDKKKADPITGQPLWLFEVKETLNRKYKDAVAPISGSDYIGKEIETTE